MTGSATAAEFTARTAAGRLRTIRLTAVRRVPRLAYVPSPLYLRHASKPYWLRVLAWQRAVYLKYNHCLHLPDTGFQRLAARALAVLRAHPAFRLVVDLRDNLGGDDRPFGALLSGLWSDPAINVRGRIFGLINGFTASSAAVDAGSLRQTTNSLPPMLHDWLAGLDPVLAEALAYGRTRTP